MACCDCCTEHKTKINLDEPYDQESYFGRVKHFFSVTNPKHFFVSSKTLECANNLIGRYACEETLPEGYTEEELWQAKTLYDSTFDPGTGEKKNFLFRPSSYIFFKSIIFGGMMTFFESVPGLAFWQILNQSFNMMVQLKNYREDELAPTRRQTAISYLASTGSAVYTAIALNRYVKKFSTSRIALRLVPFCAVAVANIISLPILRAQELRLGRAIYDEHGKLASSKVAANLAVTTDVSSRLLKVIPPLTLTPLIMDYLEKRGTLCRYPWMIIPVPLGILFVSMTFLSPFAGAIFKPKVNMPFKYIEHDLRCKLNRKKYCCRPPTYVYYKLGAPIPY